MKNETTKITCRIRNWREYNESLCNRGSLTIWINEEAITEWYNAELTGKRGASDTYSDLAIECLLVLKSVYRLGLRAVTGFARSIFGLMEVVLDVPTFSTLSRRQGRLDVDLLVSSARAAAHIVIDSTGLKVYGEGEWCVRQHGASKRRTWRKLHLAVDATTREIVGVVLSQKSLADCEVAEELLDQVEGEITQLSADGAYDTWSVYEAINARGASGVIPPRRGARIKQHANSLKPPRDRDEHLRRIRKKGRKKWKQESRYHQRSLAETTIGRYKGIFGSELRSRRADNQVTEVGLKCSILNRMTQLGLPLRFSSG